MTNYFICTKPLQYFNCKNIASSLEGNNILYILPNFTNADLFIEKIKKYDTDWTKIEALYSKKSLNSMKPLNTNEYSVYIDTDLHFTLNGSFFNKSHSICVYEEGIGTYRKKITNVTNIGWKDGLIRLLTFLGILNSRMGGNSKTKCIYLYNRDKYLLKHRDLEKKVKDFPYEFYDNYKKNRSLFIQIFNLTSIKLPENSKVLLFLTSNSRTKDFIREFKEIKEKEDKFDFYFFKPHPYVIDLYPDSENFLQDIMSEILVFELLAKKNFIKIFHYNSSTELYIHHKKVDFVNLATETSVF